MASPNPLPPIEERPAAHLEGRDLGTGWVVGPRVRRDPGATGGNFSIHYHATHTDGREGFLKALDFSGVLLGTDGTIVERLNLFTGAFLFERDLLRECGDRRLRRVVMLMDHGQVQVPEAGILREVPYLIFEKADGDIRAHQASLDAFDLTWVLRTLHHATGGIEQLHSANTAHQDLKPSNVLTQQKGQEMKLGDLGRADRRGVFREWTGNQPAGQISYMPPEQLYGDFNGTWEHRKAGDLYHIGSLAIQLFRGHNATTLILHGLEPAFHPRNWTGSFAAVLPYLESSHAEIIRDFQEAVCAVALGERVGADLAQHVAQLTAPDPAKRGHPRARKSANQYDVRRYVSFFDVLLSRVKRGRD